MNTDTTGYDACIGVYGYKVYVSKRASKERLHYGWFRLRCAKFKREYMTPNGCQTRLAILCFFGCGLVAGGTYSFNIGIWIRCEPLEQAMALCVSGSENA